MRLLMLSILFMPLSVYGQSNVSDKSKEIADILNGARKSVSVQKNNVANGAANNAPSKSVSELSTEKQKNDNFKVGTGGSISTANTINKDYQNTHKKVLENPVLLKKLTPTVENQMGLTKKILWKGQPIRVAMPVGKEQKIYMPEPGHFGTPKNVSLPIKVDSHSSVLAITPMAEFSKIRTIFYGESSGNSYLLDLSANKVNAMPYTLEVITDSGVIDKRVVIDEETKRANKLPKVGKSNFERSGLVNEVDVYQMLSRFAAQQHYAPLRVRRNPYNITEKRVNRVSLPLLRLASGVVSIPQMSWQYQNNQKTYYVTSILLKNNGTTDYQLTPNLVRNPLRTNGFAFVAATFQNSILYGNRSSNKANRSTMLYLISREPFNNVVSPMMVMNVYGDEDE